MKDYSIEFEAIPWQKATEGIKYKEFNYENKKIKLVEFNEKLVEKEWCKKGHFGYVLEGIAEVEFFNGKTCIFKKGDLILIPEGEKDKHKTKIEKGKKGLVIFFENIE